MALNFLNNCRSFDSAQNTLSFWGHDNTFEVVFRLDESALHRLSGRQSLSEAEALAIFDTNIQRIRKAARRLYRRTDGRYFKLTASDL